MSQGVPGNPPHQSFVQALASATAEDQQSFSYVDVEGTPEIRRALAAETKVVYGPSTDVAPEDIMITSGCNLAFTAVVMSLADAGDEVILPVPWYFNHQMTLSLLDITTIPLKTTEETGFLPSVEACEKLITSKTKAIALVTPNNPTGAVYPPALLTAFLELARSRGLALILDETYRDFVLPGPPHDLFSSDLPNSWRTNLIQLFSFSKSYSIPGLRLGAIAACSSHAPSLVKILDTLQICPAVPGQLALASTMASLRPSIQTIAASIAERQKLFKRSVPEGWKVGAQGGFFAFVKHPFKDVTSSEVCMRMAQEGGLVTLPDEFFTMDGEGDRWIRFSIANVGEADILEACRRMGGCEQQFGWTVGT